MQHAEESVGSVSKEGCQGTVLGLLVTYQVVQV